jgi:competence ComEA-like helix-hairpin-helix protein
MGLDQQTDSGKDKRLLVLLAFGVLLLLSRLPALVPDRQMGEQSWGWVEDSGEESALYRIVLSVTGQNEGNILAGTLPKVQHPVEMMALLQHHRAVSVQGAATASSRITPRLALLLGLPFPVNRATLDELTLLQGIGPKLAASIVNYREQHGTITDAREFRAVPGIGERLTARIAPKLSFE